MELNFRVLVMDQAYHFNKDFFLDWIPVQVSYTLP